MCGSMYVCVCACVYVIHTNSMILCIYIYIYKCMSIYLCIYIVIKHSYNIMQ